MVEDWVAGVVSHVMGGDRRKGVALESEDAAFQQHLVLVREKFGEGRELGAWLAVFEKRNGQCQVSLLKPTGQLTRCISTRAQTTSLQFSFECL